MEATQTSASFVQSQTQPLELQCLESTRSSLLEKPVPRGTDRGIQNHIDQVVDQASRKPPERSAVTEIDEKLLLEEPYGAPSPPGLGARRPPGLRRLSRAAS